MVIGKGCGMAKTIGTHGVGLHRLHHIVANAVWPDAPLRQTLADTRHFGKMRALALGGKGGLAGAQLAAKADALGLGQHHGAMHHQRCGAIGRGQRKFGGNQSAGVVPGQRRLPHPQRIKHGRHAAGIIGDGGLGGGRIGQAKAGHVDRDGP